MASPLNVPRYRLSNDHAFTIVPSDTVDCPQCPVELYVGVSGDVTILTQYDEVVTFKAVPAGAVLPIIIKRVKSTGTTATNMVGLY